MSRIIADIDLTCQLVDHGESPKFSELRDRSRDSVELSLNDLSEHVEFKCAVYDADSLSVTFDKAGLLQLGHLATNRLSVDTCCGRD